MQAKFVCFIILFCLIGNMCSAQSVGVGTSSPNASAILDVNSTNKGFLPPRMTYSQRDLILAPSAGLMVWCLDCGTSGVLQVFNGTIWQNISSTNDIPANYPNANICTQNWMTKNLSVSNYRNGDPIPKVTDPNLWSSLSYGAWCWYNNDSINYSQYGKLYNWFAVSDPRGLAPMGWHIPTNLEWNLLAIDCLGGLNIAGGKLKTTGIVYWTAPNVGATNSSGFTGYGGGQRTESGTFTSINGYGFWWSLTDISQNLAYALTLSSANATTSLDYFVKKTGYSVRCVRD